MTDRKFDNKTNTLFIKETGYIAVEEKYKTINVVLEILQKQNKLKIFQDSRAADLSGDIEEIEQLKEAVINKISGLNVVIYHAVLYDNPTNIAYSLIYESSNPDPKYKHKIFSTKQAAEIWLNEF